ncbi:MAG: cyclase family protein [bacterium]|nr:cyclase family protein [bacterium]
MKHTTCIDLTLPAQESQYGRPTFALEERPIGHGSVTYTGMIYHFQHDSMLGTYIDFPGHIKETDDGLDAATYPLEKLYRTRATILHLDRTDGSGAVTAAELESACPGPVGNALVINALGKRRFDDIEERSVYLTTDAVQWIVQTGIHLLVSDIYESQELHGVFPALFKNNIATVCYPINLHRLTVPHVTLTVLPVRFPTITQLPCRIVAEVEEDVL